MARFSIVTYLLFFITLLFLFNEVLCYQRLFTNPYNVRRLHHDRRIAAHSTLNKQSTSSNSRYPGSYECLRNESWRDMEFWCYDLLVPLDHSTAENISEDTPMLSSLHSILRVLLTLAS